MAIDSRPGPEYDDVVGFFVETLPLRGVIDRDTSFSDLIRALAPKLLNGLRHQLPYGEVITRTGHGSDPVNAFFLHHGSFSVEDADEDGIRRLYPVQDSARFDIELSTRVLDGQLIGALCLRSHLLEDGQGESTGERFGRFLTAAVSAPDTPLGRLPLLTEHEARQAVTTGEGLERHTTPALIPDMLTRQVEDHPHDTALVVDGTRLTFAELGDQVFRIAHSLIHRGIGPEHPVAVLMPRSQTQITSLLAVLCAGAVLVPIDPAHPLTRNAELLRSCASDSSSTHTPPSTSPPSSPRTRASTTSLWTVRTPSPSSPTSPTTPLTTTSAPPPSGAATPPTSSTLPDPPGSPRASSSNTARSPIWPPTSPSTCSPPPPSRWGDLGYERL
ncbi:hypothetical protein BJF83_16645 [Nocardiopsis sp. CNR-923]|nr:hypothetical protein BJF83_16645 [Nocardiopsis sp. CNR-923]